MTLNEMNEFVLPLGKRLVLVSGYNAAYVDDIASGKREGVVAWKALHDAAVDGTISELLSSPQPLSTVGE